MGADNKEPDVWKRVFQPGANPGPQPRDGSHDRVSIVPVRVILKHHHRYAVTVRIRPGVVPGTEPAPSHTGMWDFMGTLPADLPKIVVVEDLTKPVIYGSMWGEVTEQERPHTCSGECHLLQGSRGGWMHHRRRSARPARDEKCWISRDEQRGHNQSCLWSKYWSF